MQNKAIGKVLKNSLLFSIGIVFCKATSLLMLPLYTRYLSGEEYGMATTIVSFVSTFSIVLMLSLRSALIRFYGEKNSEERKQFVGTIVLFVLLNGIVITTVLVLAKGIISETVLKGIPFYPLGLMGVLALLFETIYLTYQSVLQARQDGMSYSRNSVLYMLVNIFLNVLLLVVFPLRATGMVLALLLTNLLLAVFGIWDMRRKKLMAFVIRKNILKESLRYSLPVIPHDMSNMFSSYASRLFLGNIVSYGATGLYAVASQISTVMSLVQNAMNLSFHPWFNEQMKLGEEGRSNIRKFSLLSFALYGYVCIMVSLFCKEVLWLFTAKAYGGAWRVVPILCFSLTISFVYYTHVLVIFYNVKKSKFISICSISGCVANILFILLLTPKFGMYGTALAYLLSKIVLSVVTVFYSRRVEHVDFGLKVMVLEAIGIAFIICAGLFNDYFSGADTIDVYSMLIKIPLVIALTLVMFLRYRNAILSYVKNLLSHKKS